MKLKTLAIKAAKTAGQILNDSFLRSVTVEAKAKHDIVTDVDRRSEKVILKLIRSEFPEHSIVAEESGIDKKSSPYTWYVDPLDGTVNFVTGNPYFSVSLALACRKEIILGIVYNPLLKELYYAEKGKGACLNGKRLSVSIRSKSKDALIASAYPMNERDLRGGLRTVEALARYSRRVVINFSPALDLCNIARGRIDALVDRGTTPEDHAAGSLIVQEAGGKVQDYNSDSWNVNKIGIIASNGRLHNSLIKILPAR